MSFPNSCIKQDQAGFPSLVYTFPSRFPHLMSPLNPSCPQPYNSMKNPTILRPLPPSFVSRCHLFPFHLSRFSTFPPPPQKIEHHLVSCQPILSSKPPCPSLNSSHFIALQFSFPYLVSLSFLWSPPAPTPSRPASRLRETGPCLYLSHRGINGLPHIDFHPAPSSYITTLSKG